jgi:hypothetical protein
MRKGTVGDKISFSNISQNVEIIFKLLFFSPVENVDVWLHIDILL